jgi:hypothetical protein
MIIILYEKGVKGPSSLSLGFSVVTADVRDYGKVKEVSVEKFFLEGNL